MGRESKVNKESIGLLLYGMYAVLKHGDKLSLNKFIVSSGLSAAMIIRSLKDCGILKNIGKKAGSGAVWKWVPSSAPSDLIIEKMLKHYQGQINDYLKRKDESIAAKKAGKVTLQSLPKGLAESNQIVRNGRFTPPPATSGNFVFLLERVECIGDQVKDAVDLLKTLCKNLGVTETISGRIIE